MFKAKINKENRELLLELLRVMSEVDGAVSEEEMSMILQVKKTYRMKNYTYKNLSTDQIREELALLPDEEILNILTHAILLALEDGEFSIVEREVVSQYFDLLTIEGASKLQKSINKYGKDDFDVRDLYNSIEIEEEVYEESIEMLEDFADATPEDVDETLLMKMNKGPLKKVWDQVLKLNYVIRDPKVSKMSKAVGIGALLYVILPTDVVPDVLPVLGLTDDVAIVSYAIAQLTKDKNIDWAKYVKKLRK